LKLKSTYRGLKSVLGLDVAELDKRNASLPSREVGSPKVLPTARVLYYPPFDDDEQFTDHYYRMVWYLHPIIDHIVEIVIPFEGAAPVQGPLPEYLANDIQQLEETVKAKIRYVPATVAAAIEEEGKAATLVMLWQVTDDPKDKIPNGVAKDIVKTKKMWRVDHHREQFAGSFYLKCSSEFEDPTKDIEESKEKFASIPRELFLDKGYIFGTGPSLETLTDEDFGDGTALAINSMVKNRPLMEKLNPPIITIGDPIFHAGCSSYAAQFRSYLRDAMQAFGSYLIVPQRDYRLYMANLDRELRSRIIGLPMQPGEVPNLDLNESFHVTTTSNIMSLFLLPVACTFFKDINMGGFDGRPITENDYFWKHDPASQITDRMDDIQLAHPAFFQIDYDDYYLTHCDIVARWLEEGEKQGLTFANLTHSYIPALADRTIRKQ